MLYVALVVFAFGVGAIAGAPWLPTKHAVSRDALRLLNVSAGDHVIDLGSGTGSFALIAARHGVRVTGYEINPILWLFSCVRTWPYRDLVTLKLRNYWQVSLPDADGVYVFLIDRYMAKLDTFLGDRYPDGIRVVSYVFELPREHNNEVNGLYVYDFDNRG